MNFLTVLPPRPLNLIFQTELKLFLIHTVKSVYIDTSREENLMLIYIIESGSDMKNNKDIGTHRLLSFHEYKPCNKQIERL